MVCPTIGSLDIGRQSICSYRGLTVCIVVAADLQTNYAD